MGDGPMRWRCDSSIGRHQFHLFEAVAIRDGFLRVWCIFLVCRKMSQQNRGRHERPNAGRAFHDLLAWVVAVGRSMRASCLSPMRNWSRPCSWDCILLLCLAKRWQVSHSNCAAFVACCLPRSHGLFAALGHVTPGSPIGDYNEAAWSGRLRLLQLLAASFSAVACCPHHR